MRDRVSPLMMSAAVRLGWVVLAIALLWLAVGWALA
jgi:hypothetical protein